MSGYHLETVPQPPTDYEWASLLRWMVAVMDNDDPDLGFIAGLYSFTMRNDGLTEKQARYGEKIFLRVQAQFDAGSLDFQRHAVVA